VNHLKSLRLYQPVTDVDYFLSTKNNKIPISNTTIEIVKEKIKNNGKIILNLENDRIEFYKMRGFTNFKITECQDEWFYVEIDGRGLSRWKCDQIDGLLNLLDKYLYYDDLD